MHYYLHALLLACTAKNCGSGIRGSENRVTGGPPVVILANSVQSYRINIAQSTKPVLKITISTEKLGQS